MIVIGSDAESSGNEHDLLDAASIRQNPSFDSPQCSQIPVNFLRKVSSFQRFCLQFLATHHRCNYPVRKTR